MVSLFVPDTSANTHSTIFSDCCLIAILQLQNLNGKTIFIHPKKTS